MSILNRFLKYVSISTTSNSKTTSTPSTNTQFDLAEVLLKELEDLHLDEIFFDKEHCYIYALLKGLDSLPRIGFIAHLDTSEDANGENIKPNILKDYNGESVQLNSNEILDVNKYPYLKNQKGKTLITTDGTTLLGADDKAGIVEIMTMLEKIKNSNIEHGDIYVAFTSDEEIGNGTDYFDFSRFKADFAYTVDGSELGEISYENFNAASVNINITGVSSHLGWAKNVLVNSQLIANEIINLLPKEYPENTEGYEGYYHLNFIEGNIANTTMRFLIRDFDKENFEKRKQEFCKIVDSLNMKYNNCISLTISDTYYNMNDVISDHMHIVENAKQAMKNLNVEPVIHNIRGGTDGARLCEMGLPCPNLGTGGHNFHSVYEHIFLEDMEKTSDILVEIIKLYAK